MGTIRAPFLDDLDQNWVSIKTGRPQFGGSWYHRYWQMVSSALVET